MKMSEEKKIIEEEPNENTIHAPVEEIKQKQKEATKTQAKKNNKEVKK